MNDFVYEAKDFAVYDPRLYHWYSDIFYGNIVAIHGSLVAVGSNRLPYIMLYEYDGQVWNRKDRFYPGGQDILDVKLWEYRLLASTSSLVALYQWNGTDWAKQILYDPINGEDWWSTYLRVAMSEDRIAVLDKSWADTDGVQRSRIFVFDYNPSDLMWYQRPAPLVTSRVSNGDVYEIVLAGNQVLGLTDYDDGQNIYYWAL